MILLKSLSKNSVRELQQSILAKITLRPGVLIGIDGIDGSGKSFLAAQLAPLLKATHINLDDFLIKEQGGFVDYIRYDDLRNTTMQAMANGHVIIEGCCLRAVLDRLLLNVGLHIYVKKVNYGSCLSSKFLEACCANVAIAKEEKEDEILQMLDDHSDNPVKPDKYRLIGLRRELIIYHFQYRPHERADIFYEREANPNGLKMLDLLQN